MFKNNKMKKKLILGFAATMFAAITMVNINLAMKVYSGDVTLESIAVMAQASSEEQSSNSELNTIGDSNWQHYKDLLNWMDYRWTENAVYLLSSHDTPNDKVIDQIHGFLDYYDLSGDPVFEKETFSNGNYIYKQVDDCDGQPNACS
jgi:hypothetical protein